MALLTAAVSFAIVVIAAEGQTYTVFIFVIHNVPVGTRTQYYAEALRPATIRYISVVTGIPAVTGLIIKTRPNLTDQN